MTHFVRDNIEDLKISISNTNSSSSLLSQSSNNKCYNSNDKLNERIINKSFNENMSFIEENDKYNSYNDHIEIPISIPKIPKEYNLDLYRDLNEDKWQSGLIIYKSLIYENNVVQIFKIILSTLSFIGIPLLFICLDESKSDGFLELSILLILYLLLAYCVHYDSSKLKTTLSQKKILRLMTYPKDKYYPNLTGNEYLNNIVFYLRKNMDYCCIIQITKTRADKEYIYMISKNKLTKKYIKLIVVNDNFENPYLHHFDM